MLGARHPLSVRELLAILEGSGGRSGSAFDVVESLLEMADGSLRRLGTVDPGALEGADGVGAATASRIVAALELGRRRVAL